jgi:hypothetical protein
VCSYLPAVVDASWVAEFPVTGTPAGTVVVRACGLQVHGGTVTVAGNAPPAGELAVFCRPVVTAPAAVRRHETVLADGWLPDLVRLGELERHLGDGVIEAAVETALAEGRLKPRQRRRLMSYPLVIRLMIAMTLLPGASYCKAVRRVAELLADMVKNPPSAQSRSLMVCRCSGPPRAADRSAQSEHVLLDVASAQVGDALGRRVAFGGKAGEFPQRGLGVDHPARPQRGGQLGRVALHGGRMTGGTRPPRLRHRPGQGRPGSAGTAAGPAHERPVKCSWPPVGGRNGPGPQIRTAITAPGRRWSSPPAATAWIGADGRCSRSTPTSLDAGRAVPRGS